MTTKERKALRDWLSRGADVDKRIRTLENLRKKEWERLTSMTTRLDGEPVQATHDPHKNDSYVALVDQIREEEDTLLRIKAEREAVISKVPNIGYRNILTLRYVEGLPWRVVAESLHFSERRAQQLDIPALASVAPLISAK